MDARGREDSKERWPGKTNHSFAEVASRHARHARNHKRQSFAFRMHAGESEGYQHHQSRARIHPQGIFPFALGPIIFQDVKKLLSIFRLYRWLKAHFLPLFGPKWTAIMQWI